MLDKRMREAYDRIAAEYAAQNSEMRAGLERWGLRFVEEVGHAAPVLDLGCGAGRDTAWLAARGVRVVGTDLSAGMLAQARLRTGRPLVQADMRLLPFPAGRFRGVWCMASLLHLPKAEAPLALAEMRRVLAPGGALIVGLHEGRGEAWEPSPYGPVERFFSRYSREEAAELLRSCAFSVRGEEETQGNNRSWLLFFASAQS